MLSHVFFGYWDPISAFPQISFERLLYKRVKKIVVFPVIGGL